MPIYPNTQLTFTTNGITGTTITSSSITTSSINTQRITIMGNTGAPGNIISKTNNNITWSSLTSNENIRSSNLNMQTNNITNATNITCTTIDPTTITTTTFANQTSFTTAPISYYPTTSSQLATKSYVDNTLLTNKHYYLYLNPSIPRFFIGTTGYYTLSTTITGETGQGITGQTIVTARTLIGSFMTPFLNITNIPPSLWILHLYSGLPNISATSGVFSTFFELYKYSTSTAVTSIIGTSSSNAGDINTNPSNSPDLYKMTLSVSSYISLLPTDRLFINLYYSSTTASIQYSTYYEKNWYSYLEILSNNSSTLYASTAYSNIDMNSFNITSNGNMDVSCPNKLLSLGNNASTINIGTDTSVSTNINLGFTGTNNIVVGCPLTPINIQLPGEEQLGQIKTYPRVTEKMQASSFNMEYTLPYNGRWFITATFGIYISASITISSISVNLYTSNNILITEYSDNKHNAIIESSAYCNIVNISGIVDNSNTSITGFYLECIYNSTDNTKIFTYNDPSDLYIVQAVRLA